MYRGVRDAEYQLLPKVGRTGSECNIDLAYRATSVASVFAALRKWRRRRLEKVAFPSAWPPILRERIRYYRLSRLTRDL